MLGKIEGLRHPVAHLGQTPLDVHGNPQLLSKPDGHGLDEGANPGGADAKISLQESTEVG